MHERQDDIKKYFWRAVIASSHKALSGKRRALSGFYGCQDFPGKDPFGLICLLVRLSFCGVSFYGDTIKEIKDSRAQAL